MRSAPIIQEMLEAVGIKIDLRQPIEFSTYSDVLEKDSDDWDLYLLGWSLSSTDPDPSGLWGSKAAYNYGRWNNKESDELMKRRYNHQKHSIKPIVIKCIVTGKYYSRMIYQH